eukprot:2341401-Prymnesium_polylepis.1
MEAASHYGTFRSSLISRMKALVTGFHLPYQRTECNPVESHQSLLRRKSWSVWKCYPNNWYWFKSSQAGVSVYPPATVYTLYKDSYTVNSLARGAGS